jgi:3',5'-cyclic AMP phosphodiesterase CpdA
MSKNEIEQGTNRRDFMKCMAWAGTGLVWTLSAGMLSSKALAGLQAAPNAPRVGGAGKSSGGFRFVQISDTHIGFEKDPNKDPVATLQEAIARIRALDPAPDFLIHTGDLTHAQKAGAFDTVAQLVTPVTAGGTFFVPGEHDVFGDGGKEYLAHFGKGTQGGGWRSFDHQGVHFIGLVNVLDFKSSGLGMLGSEQLEWLEDDVRARSSSTPIVVYTHIPLWEVYPQWGWTTGDAQQALAYLKRFGSVTVLNGHVHQVLQKVEGQMTFHTAMSTAFPQPAPGMGPGPGPLKVPTEEVRRLLGLRSVTYRAGTEPLAIVDSTLG